MAPRTPIHVQGVITAVVTPIGHLLIILFVVRQVQLSIVSIPLSDLPLRSVMRIVCVRVFVCLRICV